MPIQQKIEQFIKKQGRRPRVLVSNMGRESHDQDNKLLASLLAESGFDVDISPLHQTPRGTARMAIENDVHIICFLSIEHKQLKLVTEMARALKRENAQNIKIVIGGVIPRSDPDFLNDAGVDQILNSVQLDSEAVNLLLDLYQ